MKKSIKIILGFIILLIGIVILFFVYKAHFSKNTSIEIYKRENDYKVYLKSDTNKEIVGYKLYKTFGIDINENESIVGFDLNITNNKLNGVIITCKGSNSYQYETYYNLKINKNMFKDMNRRFDI